MITGLPAGGVLQYYDSVKSEWVEITDDDLATADDPLELDANILKTGGPDGVSSGLRFVNNGSEVRESSFTVKALDRWNAESVEDAKVTIFVTNVNDTPEIAQTPDHDDPSGTNGDPSKIGDPAQNNPITVVEGGREQITAGHLQAYDPDSTDKQVQFTITKDSEFGDIVIFKNGSYTKLGEGSSFTQADIKSGIIYYTHKGGDENSSHDRYDDHFIFTLSDGDKEQTHREFWINVTPTNDAPVITMPDGPIRPDNTGTNNIPGVSVSDPDLDDNVIPGVEEDFIQVTVRVKDQNGAVVTSGVTISTDDTNGSGLLTLQGKRAEVNAALENLQVSFDSDVNQKYTLEVIADDRLRDSNGNVVGANGGDKNQSVTPGGEPTDINIQNYNWSTAEVPANHGNITVDSVEIWSSKSTNRLILLCLVAHLKLMKTFVARF